LRDPLTDEERAAIAAERADEALCGNVTETATPVEIAVESSWCPVTMLNMSKKNGAASPREGTAAAVREAARSSAPSPAPSSLERPMRRTFSAEYKRRIVREADAAVASGNEGAVASCCGARGVGRKTIDDAVWWFRSQVRVDGRSAGTPSRRAAA